MRMITAVLAGLMLATSVGAASAADVKLGQLRAIDADTLTFEDKQRVILWGVDAPERDQPCLFADNSKYSCYEESLRTLETLAGRGEASCELIGEPDRFNRYYARCKIGETDIGAELIRAGMALAFLEQSDEYVPAEQEAEAAQIGVWQPGVNFIEPWVWRKRNPGGFR